MISLVFHKLIKFLDNEVSWSWKTLTIELNVEYKYQQWSVWVTSLVFYNLLTFLHDDRVYARVCVCVWQNQPSVTSPTSRHWSGVGLNCWWTSWATGCRCSVPWSSWSPWAEPPSRTPHPLWWWPPSTSTPMSWREALSDSSPAGNCEKKLELVSNFLSNAQFVFYFSRSLTCHRHSRDMASVECRCLSSPWCLWQLWWFLARWHPAGKQIHPRCSEGPQRDLPWDRDPNICKQR